MQFKTTLEKFNSNLWGYHILVPDDIAQVFLKDKHKRIICTLNEEVVIHCALMPKGGGTNFININKEVRKKLHLHVGKEVFVTLEKDESEYGLPVPEEFAALIEMDEEGHYYFHQLSKGKQRSLLHIMGKPKHTDTRLKKAVVIVDYLKATKGKLDFQELNQAFKDYNQR